VRFAAAVLVLLIVACGREPPARPSVLLITLDTTRPDHLGCYGHAGGTSPNVDALAAESEVYDNALSTSSWTLPAHASLFTGQVPTRHQARYDEQGPLVLTQAIAGPFERYRVRGFRPDAVTLAQILRDSPSTQLVNFDWGEKNKTIRLAVNQDKVRQAGLSSDAVAQTLNMILSGEAVTQIRDSIYLIDVVARAPAEERLSMQALRTMQINLPSGQAIPLAQIATIEYALDESYIWRRDRLPTITVQADVPPGITAATAYQRNAPAVAALRAKLPPAAKIVEGGAFGAAISDPVNS